MNLLMQEQNAEEIANATVDTDDRRTHDRLKLMKTVHISCFDSAQTQDTATVVDISREGLYFTVRSSHYHIGMEMRVTIRPRYSTSSASSLRMSRSSTVTRAA